MRYIAIIILFTSTIIFAQDATGYTLDTLEVISVDNVSQLELLAEFGDGTLRGAAEWSPDGESFAVSGSIGVWLFQMDDFENPFRLDHDSVGEDVEWSPDGTLLYSVTKDTTQLWDVSTWEVIETMEGGDDISFSPDGKYILLTRSIPWGNTGLDTATIVDMIERSTGEIISTIPIRGYATGYAFFTADNKFIVTASSCYFAQYCDDPTSFIAWDVDDLPSYEDEMLSLYIEEYPLKQPFVGANPIPLTGSKITYFNYEPDAAIILDLATGRDWGTSFAGDIRQIASSGTQLYVKVSNDNQDVLYTIDSESNSITGSVTINLPNRNYFSVSSQNNELVVLNDSQRISLAEVEEDELVETVSFELNQPVLADIHADAVELGDTDYSCTTMPLEDSETRCGAYSNDGTLFAGRDDFNDVYLWNAETLESELITEIEPNDNSNGFAFSADDSRLVFYVSDCLMNGRCPASTMFIYDVTKRSILGEITSDLVRQLLLSPATSNNLLVAITENGVFETRTITFYDIETGTQLLQLPPSSPPIRKVTFSSDGKLLFVRYADDVVKVWGVPTQP